MPVPDLSMSCDSWAQASGIEFLEKSCRTRLPETVIGSQSQFAASFHSPAFSFSLLRPGRSSSIVFAAAFTFAATGTVTGLIRCRNKPPVPVWRAASFQSLAWNGKTSI